MSRNSQIALVTGGNRGIGLEVCSQLADLGIHVLLAARSEKKGREQVSRLSGKGVDFLSLDVSCSESIEAAYQEVVAKYGAIEILINNAGACLDFSELHPSKTKISDLKQMMETNLYGPFRLCQLFAPMMKKRGYGRIVNVSSVSGQLSTMGCQSPGYAISKAALNAETRVFASEYAGENVLINSVCPGWCHTEMGGELAPRSPSKGAEVIVWAATLPDGGPTGGFFQDQKELEW